MIVHHDPVVAGLGPICQRTVAELPGYVPILSAALDACQQLQVNVEIKSDPKEPDYDETHGLTRAVVAALATDVRRDRYIISSFDREVVNLVKELAPDLATGFLYSMTARPAQLIQRCVADGHVAIHPHHLALTQRTVKLALEAGLAVNTWTVDDPDRMQTLAKWGVSTVITNVPDVARDAFPR